MTSLRADIKRHDQPSEVGPGDDMVWIPGAAFGVLFILVASAIAASISRYVTLIHAIRKAILRRVAISELRQSILI
jgi:hypothetical protein